MSKVSRRNINSNLEIVDVSFDDLFVCLSNLGAGIIDIKYIDKFGIKESVVAQPIDPLDYIDNGGCHGKTCGRVAGRIDKGRFELDGNSYQLDINWNGVSNLHGGFDGIGNKYFAVSKIIEETDYVEITYFTIALDKESGFPGNLEIMVTYRITNNTVEITYSGKTDKKTLCNLTNHTYFNLSGNCKNDVLDQWLFLNASKYTNLNNELITVSIDDVNEIFNFKSPKLIKQHIFDEALKKHISFGYDHCFILDDRGIDKVNASLYDCTSGRKMDVYTTYPSIVMYACCYPGDKIISSNQPSTIHDSICLECQYIPNSINMNQEDTILDIDEMYSEKTVYKFSID